LIFSGICNLSGALMKVPDFKSKSLVAIESALANNSNVYEWLSWNSDLKSGTFIKAPERLQIPENIKEQLIVELYSK
jgi:small subunit ribosomal protein S4